MMDMKGFARDYLARAKERIMDASSALSRKSYPEVIRYSQEATELSLKASLRFVGVEYPKVHDVGDVLTERREKWSSTTFFPYRKRPTTITFLPRRYIPQICFGNQVKIPE